MTRILAVAVALTGLALSSQGASAFTLVNQDNYAQGGARMMLNNPDAQYSKRNLRDGSGDGTNNSRSGNGYGGLGIYDMTRSDRPYEQLPSFPGSENHLTPGANAGMLMYGATPGRR